MKRHVASDTTEMVWNMLLTFGKIYFSETAYKHKSCEEGKWTQALLGGNRGEELKLSKRSCDPRELMNGSRLTAVPKETAGSVVSSPGLGFLLFLGFLPRKRWRGDLCHLYLSYFRWPGMKQRRLERVSRVNAWVKVKPQLSSSGTHRHAWLKRSPPTAHYPNSRLCLLSSKPASHCLDERWPP